MLTPQYKLQFYEIGRHLGVCLRNIHSIIAFSGHGKIILTSIFT